jgi:hypothetical protein
MYMCVHVCMYVYIHTLYIGHCGLCTAIGSMVSYVLKTHAYHAFMSMVSYVLKTHAYHAFIPWNENTHKYAANFCVSYTITLCAVHYRVKYAGLPAYLCVFKSPLHTCPSRALQDYKPVLLVQSAENFAYSFRLVSSGLENHRKCHACVCMWVCACAKGCSGVMERHCGRCV